MGRLTLRRSYVGLAFRLLAVLPVVALFAIFLGPLLDPHFSERLLGHDHIYPGGMPVEHTHAYDAPHGVPTGGGPEGGPESDIIFLPPDNEAIPSFATAFAAILPASLIATLGLVLLPASCGGERVYRPQTPRPEPPPPRFLS